MVCPPELCFSISLFVGFQEAFKEPWVHPRPTGWGEFTFPGHPAPFVTWKHLEIYAGRVKARWGEHPCKSQHAPAGERGSLCGLGSGRGRKGAETEKRIQNDSVKSSFGFQPKTRASLIILHILEFSFYSIENEKAKASLCHEKSIS